MALLFAQSLRQTLGVLGQQGLPLQQSPLTQLAQLGVAQDVAQGHLGGLEPLDEVHPVELLPSVMAVARRGSWHRAQQTNLEAHSIARAHDCAAAAAIAIGAPATQVMAQATETGCDLVVLGSHGHGWIYDRLIGSVAAHVVTSGQMPVLLVR